MTSDRLRGKLAGLAILVFGIIPFAFAFLFLWPFGLLSIYELLARIASLVLISLVSIVIVIVGMKLLVYSSSRPIALDEIRRRASGKSTMPRISIRPLVICFSGIDGSGKTTQLTFIAERLKETGIRYKYVRLRWAAFLSYPFLVFCRLTGFTRWKIQRGVLCVEHNFYTNKAIARIWTLVFTFDIIIHYYYRVRLPLRRGYHVLCDRFILDALVDMMYDTRQPELFNKLAGKLLLSLVSKDYLTLFFDLDEQKAYERKKDVPSIDFLRERRRLYRALAHRFNIPILDAGKSPGYIRQEIIERFIRHYPFWWSSISEGTCASAS